ncbi:hypothetical protein DLH98_23555 [Vibrio parahaemolyticus]|uniref:hypothetical protein n=2 Tax=Vibrio parahaemolyticus TaxID=670 RepID=UPI000428C20F|nr:hypothetical protein [Vibrio parahaemolyticus]EGQ8926257.1 hypothetical protein [Vibrio parahaemolyticus]EGR2948256.1 hypothetical protein [Vibrio parahaemolyticus]EGR3067722.1 hypothetical protein [Vibrio parahaemolyticus]EMA9069293.1 hypothetical protein [Vibrio parahaemolyticus]MCW7949144.1 hypothetical protein [Vibrio parahaemolyticus]
MTDTKKTIRLGQMEEIIQDFFDDIDFDNVEKCDASKEKSCVDCLSNGYFSDIQIDYSCFTKRKLYVVRYLPVHVAEVVNALKSIPATAMEQLLDNKQLNILCVGGGPGTDNLALNTWLDHMTTFKDYRVSSVTITRLDKCEEWDDISPNIIWEQQPESLDFELHRKLYDVTKTGLKTTKSHLVVMSYIMSEIKEKQLVTLAENLLKNTYDGWVLVVNDRDEVAVTAKVEKLVKLLKGRIVVNNNSKPHCGFTYPDEIWEKAEPKIWLKSARYVAII